MAKGVRKKTQAVSNDFSFFNHLWQFYKANRSKVRSSYKDLTKKFLDYNDPSKGNAFLRQPQFEALEVYVLLKEYLNNRQVYEIFKAWRESSDQFAGRQQASLFEEIDKHQYDLAFERMRRYARSYSNYIFALTMGTGKTILMATCIFYEFLLANKFPKDGRYCHNALVFAPDKTVLQSLREIQTFDMSKVVPPEYSSFLSANIQYHFLDEAGISLNTLDKSRFNLIISNTQKIILKRDAKEKTYGQKLFKADKVTYTTGSIYESFYANTVAEEDPEDEDSLVSNQRFEKIRRLEQLGIYVDEAHHAFGDNLAKDMGSSENSTSLRKTIDGLASSLQRANTKVVACFNFTGTPYVRREVLPEVVYAYGLQDAINNRLLKNVRINGYSNTRNNEFINLAIEDFLKRVGDERYENMLPKIAFFASTIEELQQELRPAVEAALAKHNIPASRILVNVGDERITSNDDIREFNRLDTPQSEKQFILLVNKGKEGWNCRSLFGVGLFREPRSKIFVLQATMRCLRAITDYQQTGNVYLSDDNKALLENELQQNFRVSIDDIATTQDDKKSYQVRVTQPPVTIKLKRIKKLYTAKEKLIAEGASLELHLIDKENYRIKHTSQEGLSLQDAAKSWLQEEDLTAKVKRRTYSELTLVAEISRYMNKSPLSIAEMLAKTKEGTAAILEAVNEFNDVLYDWVIPRLFKLTTDLKEFTSPEEYPVELVKVPREGFLQSPG